MAQRTSAFRWSVIRSPMSWKYRRRHTTVFPAWTVRNPVRRTSLVSRSLSNRSCISLMRFARSSVARRLRSSSRSLASSSLRWNSRRRSSALRASSIRLSCCAFFFASASSRSRSSSARRICSRLSRSAARRLAASSYSSYRKWARANHRQQNVLQNIGNN